MKPRVLLVEDDPTTRAFLHAATQVLDVDIDLAASMQQALALARSTEYALWLLDTRLPDGNGVELLGQLCRLSQAVPALAHTALTDKVELQRLRDAGFDAALSKPVAATDWQVAVQALLSSQAHAVSLWDDVAALKILDGNPYDLSALRSLFVHELTDQIDTLKRACAEGNMAAIKSELHRLKASCNFVGAARLAAVIKHWQNNSATIHEVLSVAQDTLPAYPVVGNVRD